MKLMSSILLICFCLVSAISAQDEPDKEVYFNSVKKMIKEGDLYQALQFVNNQPTPEKSGTIYIDLAKDFYWKEKNIEQTINLSQAGIQYLLIKSDELRVSDPQRGYELKHQAKTIAYNLASFCWPGWDEAGINLSIREINLGLEAAKLNVRFAKELSSDGLSLAIDYWLLGASFLAIQKYDRALDSFLKSKKHAHEASDLLSELLADGYIGITMIIKGNPEGDKRLAKTITKLTGDGSEDALYYIEQFNTVMNVFIK